MRARPGHDRVRLGPRSPSLPSLSPSLTHALPPLPLSLSLSPDAFAWAPGLALVQGGNTVCRVDRASSLLLTAQGCRRGGFRGGGDEHPQHRQPDVWGAAFWLWGLGFGVSPSRERQPDVQWGRQGLRAAIDACASRAQSRSCGIEVSRFYDEVESCRPVNLFQDPTISRELFFPMAAETPFA
jgi:hypothetical protein